MFKRANTGVLAVGLLAAVSGCSSQVSANIPDQTAFFNPSPPSTLETNGLTVTVQPLTKGNSDTLHWSPSGNRFCYMKSDDQSFVIGTVKPFSLKTVLLPDRRHIVALTDNAAVAASWNDDQNWLYPITNNGLGEPTSWKPATDTWQSWVDTEQAPGVLIGGYEPKSLALQLEDGRQVPLFGEDAFVSIDRNYGAVATSRRLKRVVNPIGDVNMPSEHQGADPTKPITIWNFAAPGGPKQQAQIEIPAADRPTMSQGGAWISFSPDDKYVLVSVNTGGDGSKLTGETYLFDSAAGKFISKTPFGNGRQWLADGSGIWLNTDQPQGTGEDKVYTLGGQLVHTWPDADGQPAWVFNQQTFLMSNNKQQLGLIGWDHTFHAFPNLPAGFANRPVLQCPNGDYGLLDLYNNTPPSQSDTIALITFERK